MNFLSYRPLTEIEFLSRQTKIRAVGVRSTTGTMCEITPADGLTFVLIGASVVYASGTATAADVQTRLRNDGSTIEEYSAAINTSLGDSIGQIVFISKGEIMIGDGVRIFDFDITTANSQRVSGTIYGYLRNT